jgi:hypothetical protein
MRLAFQAALLFVLAWPGQAIDDAARAWVQAHRTPWLEAPMRFASDRARVVMFAGGAVALIAGPPGRAFVLEAVVALLPVNVAVEGLKWSVNRTRPDGEHRRSNSSFPSSHAANAFTLAAVITRRWRRAAIPAWLAASFVAMSRHLPRSPLALGRGVRARAGRGRGLARSVVDAVPARPAGSKATRDSELVTDLRSRHELRCSTGLCLDAERNRFRSYARHSVTLASVAREGNRSPWQ